MYVYDGGTRSGSTMASSTLWSLQQWRLRNYGLLNTTINKLMNKHQLSAYNNNYLSRHKCMAWEGAVRAVEASTPLVARGTDSPGKRGGLGQDKGGPCN